MNDRDREFSSTSQVLSGLTERLEKVCAILSDEADLQDVNERIEQMKCELLKSVNDRFNRLELSLGEKIDRGLERIERSMNERLKS